MCAEGVVVGRSIRCHVSSLNEISSPTYTTLIFVLYHVILCSFFL